MFTWDGRLPARMPEARRKMEEFGEFNSQFGQYDHLEVRPLAEPWLMPFGSSAGPPMVPNYWYNNNYTITMRSCRPPIM